jgi:hypothetical protein
MSERIRSSRTSRVVERPAAAAAATSAAFAAAIGANRSPSDSASANRSKKSLICSSVDGSEGGERLAGVGHGVRDQRADIGRDQQERSGGLYDDQTVAVAEAFGQLGGHHGNPVAAERDLLSFGDAGERSYLGLRRHGVSVGTCPRLRSTSVSCSPGVTSPSVTRSPRRW